jgi:hypothetical protein
MHVHENRRPWWLHNINSMFVMLHINYESVHLDISKGAAPVKV